MKRTRLTQDEQALRQRLEARAIPSPSRAIRARVMEAAQAALRDEATPLSAPRQNHLRRRFAFSLVTLSALAALVVVVAHLHFETRKEAIPASRLGMPTSTSHGPRTASSTTAMPARQHTGTLRQVVKEQLARHPLVKSYRPGGYGEGGGGVTIVELADK